VALPHLLYPAPAIGGFDEWVHANYQHHLAVLQALRTQTGYPFTLYSIFPAPVSDQDIATWLEEHAQQHSDMCAATGVVSTDLSSVDFKDPSQRDSWMFYHYKEHEAVAQALRLTV